MPHLHRESAPISTHATFVPPRLQSDAILHWHLKPEQPKPGGHERPQAPQFCGSVAREWQSLAMLPSRSGQQVMPGPGGHVGPPLQLQVPDVGSPPLPPAPVRLPVPLVPPVPPLPPLPAAQTSPGRHSVEEHVHRPRLQLPFVGLQSAASLQPQARGGA